MSSALKRVRRMSDSSESILYKMGRTNLATFMSFITVDNSLDLVGRCLDPKKLRNGCVLFIDTKKFVIRNLRPAVDR